jgi:transposase
VLVQSILIPTKLNKTNSKKILSNVKEVLPENIEIKNVEIWFQDEARFGQQGSITRMWAVKGTRPRAIRQRQFKYTYLFGAVCPARGVGIGLVFPYANSDTMSIHLEYISAQIPSGKHAVIVLDRAGWHTSKKLKTFSNLTMFPLPAASPELNPCEQIWRKLREDSLSNRSFKSEEELVQSCCDAWNQFVDKPETICSLCTRQWAIV